MYIHREIEKILEKVSASHECVVIYGPRQVGKSTLLSIMKGDSYKIITLDDADKRELAQIDPEQFLAMYSPPVIIDEIQKANNALFEQIKILIDNIRVLNLKENKKNRHLIYLTGSSQYNLKEKIDESLAGRIGIIEMNSFSYVEIVGISGNYFNPDINAIIAKEKNAIHRNRSQIFADIFKGGMPRVITNESDWDEFYKSYIDNYLEKDIKHLINVDYEITFRIFLKFIALRTAQEIKYEELSKNLGIDVRTVKSWLSILESTGIIKFLHPFMATVSKTIIKTPKMYFMDTGLCVYLCGWQDASMLEAGIMNGSIYETYVISEIIKSFINNGKRIENCLYYYRDTNQKEVDLIYVNAEKIFPIEIKAGISPSKSNKNFNVLNKYDCEIMPGIIIYSGKEIKCLNKNAYLVPIGLIGL